LVTQEAAMLGDKTVRILDAAEALLVAFGYRKLTIDEVAARAGIGKGTVYLYWPSKRELCAAVLTRDSARRLAEHLDALVADPAEAQLHRMLRRTFLQAMHGPLARALATADRAVLGEVLTANSVGTRFTLGSIDTTAHHLALLHRHGLLADDPADPVVFHRLSTAVIGSFLLDVPGTEHVPGADLSLAEQADALATTVRRAFEPATEPAPGALHAAAAELAELYRKWLTELDGNLPRS
jgi:AcrR family transcriptional regulator